MNKTFCLWRLLVSIKFTKWTWTTTTEKEQMTHLLSVTIVERDGHKALSLILGPLAVITSMTG